MISGGDGKLRINLLSWDFFRNIFMRLRLMYFGVVVMNCIRDIEDKMESWEAGIIYRLWYLSPGYMTFQ